MASRNLAGPAFAPAIGAGPCAITVSDGATSKLWQAGGLVAAADGRIKGLDGLGALLDGPDEDIKRLLAAWRSEGARCLDHVRGDFAISLWEQDARRLHLIRDPLGFRPLFFVRTKGGVAFASRADAFAALADQHGRPDFDALVSHLCFRTDTGRGFFSGVEQVRPGEIVTFADGAVERRQWWRPSLTADGALSPQDAIHECRELLDAAVSDCLEDAGPVLAAHLSAGLDSGVVAALAARLRPDSTRLLALTGVPGTGALTSDPRRLIDEGPLAAQVAATLPAVEHKIVTASGSPLAPMLDAARLYQQPLPNPFNYGWFSRIQDRAAQAGARTLLIGQTGNYSFSMSGHKATPARTMARWIRAHIPSRAGRAGTDFFLRERPETAAGEPIPDALTGAERRLYFLSSLNPGSLVGGVHDHWGIELRDPFADRRLVEFSLRLPEKLLCALGDRGLARPIAADLLPPAILAERRRGYQSADWVSRLRACHGDVSRILAFGRDNADLRRVLDVPALEKAAGRLAGLRAVSAEDEQVYRIDLPRALAAIAFVQSLEAGPSRALSGVGLPDQSPLEPLTACAINASQ